MLLQKYKMDEKLLNTLNEMEGLSKMMVLTNQLKEKREKTFF